MHINRKSRRGEEGYGDGDGTTGCNEGCDAVLARECRRQAGCRGVSRNWRKTVLAGWGGGGGLSGKGRVGFVLHKMRGTGV